ncbi:MAG: tetratricopeptide repeat protein [Planctomycetes bacterium]|nr:tetratricopeptide repeat protein [Planctomycetota bacterium]
MNLFPPLLLLAGLHGLLTGAALAEGVSLRLSEERQKIVDQYMDILLADARNDFAFRQVYGAFKSENKEYLLVNFFQNAIRLEPGRASLHLILGQLYASFRDLYQAGVKFQEAAKLDPKDFYARYLLAGVYHKQKKYDAAASEFRVASALAGDMDDRVRSLFGLAQVYAALSDGEEARKTWEEVAELRPFDTATLRQLADAARVFQRWDLAERWLGKLLELVTEDPEATCSALIDLAEVARQQKRFDAAVERYRKARSFLSESHWLSAEIHARIRQCFAEQGRGASLDQELEARIQRNGRDLDALLERAELLAAEGRPGPAAECLQAASAASPRDVQILEKLRAARVQVPDDAGVEDATRRLLALSPQNVHYKLQDAEYHVQRGHRDRARAIWDDILREDPRQPARYASVARAMKRAGELDTAEETYRRLVEVDPETEMHRIELAELCLRRAAESPAAGADPGTGGPAEPYFLKARDMLLGASQRGKLTLAETQYAGLLLLEHRRLEEARQVLETGRQRFTSDMALAHMLGETCLRLGAARDAASPDKNALFDEALRQELEAFDLAPHPAVQREMNAELMSLCLGYGIWTAGDGKTYRGGPQGLTSLLGKHVRDYFARPKDPMPAWCIGDIQQQGPASYFSFANIPNGSPKGFGFYTGGGPRTDAGLSFFSDALQRDPLFVPGYLSNSVSYVLRDSFEQAVVELRKAAVIDPVNKWKYFLQIGDLFANEGQLEEARAFWNRVAERVFTDATLFYQLGTRYFRAGQTAEAVAMLQKAIETNPNLHSYHMTLGNMYDYLGDYPRAVASYRRALELATQSMLLPVRQRLSEIQRSWAYELFDGGEHEKALQQFRDIREFQEKLEAYYRAEKDERAAARLSLEAADVQVQIARCLEALGQPAEARPLYDRVAQELPAAPIRIARNRTLSLRYFLRLQGQSARLGPDCMGPAGEVAPRPFTLRLVHQSRLYDVAREHSLTPAGVLYSGLARWVEVDPLSGRVLREMPAGKAIRSRGGLEVQVRRGDAGDQIQLRRGDASVEAASLGPLHVRMSDLQITPGRVLFVASGGTATRILAVDAATGAAAWNVEASPHTQDIACGEDRLAALESDANQTSVVLRDAGTGQTLWMQKLAPGGIWHQPVIAAGKLFLAEDTAWELHALDLATGESLYSLTFEDLFPRPPLVHEGVLYLHVRGFKRRTIDLYALDPETGRILWKSDLKAMSAHSPLIFLGPDIVLLDPETRRIFKVDRATGVRHADASYEEFLTESQHHFLQFLQPFGEHILLVGGRGDIHALKIEN